MITFFLILVSTGLTIVVGAIALGRSRFDFVGRVLTAFVVGQAVLTVSAGVLDWIDIKFGVFSAVLAGLATAAVLAPMYKINPTQITAWRPALPALLVTGCIWGGQAVAAIRFGLHHYDFTFYHDILARSLAHTGRLTDPYLVSLGYGSWYLADYGSSVVMDAFNALLVPGASKLAWYLNALLLPPFVLLLVAKRAGTIASLVTAIAFVFLYPLMLVDPRPHNTIAMFLAIACVAALTSRPESRSADAVLIAIVTVAAVLAKREAFVIFFFPCGLFFLMLLRDRLFGTAVRFGALAGIPVVLTLVYRISVPAHGGLSVGMPSTASSIEILHGTLTIIGERVITNNGNLTVALVLGLVGSVLQPSKSRRLIALVLFLTQLLAFALFVYVTHEGGLNNYSTDYRKASYPLIVAIVIFGLGVGSAVPTFMENHVRHRLAIGLVAGVIATVWHGNLQRYSEPYDFIRGMQNNWNELLNTLGLEQIHVVLLPGENFDTLTYMGGLTRPHGLAAAIYPREVRYSNKIPPDADGPIFIVSETGPVEELSDLDGKIFETSWGLRFWSAKPVPGGATNGWSVDHPVTDTEAEVSFSMDEGVVFIESWGGKAAIAYSAPGQEIDLTLQNTGEQYLTRLMLDAYPAAREDAPVHVEVYDDVGTLLYESAISDLPRFRSWIIPLQSASPKFTIRFRVGDAGVMRFFHPRAMTLRGTD